MAQFQDEQSSRGSSANAGNFQDQQLACADCGAEFTFTAAEQAFFADKGFASPKRCPQCRDKKKQERTANRQFTKVTCAQCGTETEVPFVPRFDRPVLCRDCFDQQRGKRAQPMA